MIYWSLDSETHIYPFKREHGVTLFKLIQANQEHMNRWMQWSAGIRDQSDVDAIIEIYQQKLRMGDGFNCGIWYRGNLAGAIVCRYIDTRNSNAEIGYWLGERFMGNGLATRAAGVAASYLFENVGLHRVEMQCGIENTRSRAIPERLGFTLEGIRRESHFVAGRYMDHAVYSMLSGEWLNQHPIEERQAGK